MEGKKLGIFLVGVLGSIATTLIAGVAAAKKGVVPIQGAITETELTKTIPLIALENIYFAGWDIREKDCFTMAIENQVVPPIILEKVQEELEKIPVYPGVRMNLASTTLQVYDVEPEEKIPLLLELERLRNNIKDFKREFQLDYIVVVNVSSTEPLVDEQLLE